MNTPHHNCRLRLPERNQVEIRFLALDQLLPDDHQARLVWAYVEGLDLTPLYQAIQARQGVAGRDANDPRILMALWLYATFDGVGSARRLDQLCQESLPYQWLAGGVSMNYHSLADFRVEHVALLDQLLTDGVAALLHQGLAQLTRVAQDGMKVRASAGSSSFRRRATLAQCLEEAQAQVAALKTASEEDAAAVSRRQQAARERAARERQQRVQTALQEAEQLAQRRQEVERSKGVPAKPERASTSDPEARTMKMGDGGFRPAYNAQFATTTVGGVIVGVAVTSSGSDSGQMPQMVDQLHKRYGRVPQEMLADGGFATLDDIQTVHEQQEVKVYAPIKDEDKKREQGVDPYAPRPRDKEGVALWRQRMGTAEAKVIYRERASAAEWVNAMARNRGLYQVRVRGRLKVLAVLLWQALAHNLLRALALRKAAAG
ncbi:MAG: IS1182 family transposase [Pirellulales bacterium]